MKNLQLKKEILNSIKYCNGEYGIKVCCYSEESDGSLTTDVNVELYSNDEYLNTIVVDSMEQESPDNTEEWWNRVEEHRLQLKKTKNKVYKYLCNNFNNVCLGIDYVW